MRRSHDGDRCVCHLVDGLQDHGAELGHDIGEVTEGLFDIMIDIRALVIEDASPMRTEPAKGVTGKENPVGGLVGHHRFGPVHHGRSHKLHLSLPQGKRLTIAHDLDVLGDAIECSKFVPCLLGSNKCDPGSHLLETMEGARVIGLHVVDDEIVDFRKIGNLPDLTEELVGFERFGRIDDRFLLVPDEIGIVSHTFPGDGPHVLEKIGCSIIHPDPVNIRFDFHDWHDGTPPFRLDTYPSVLLDVTKDLAAQHPSCMIPQVQLHRVWMQIVLVFQVRLIVFADIVIDQGDGDDQRHVTLMIHVDDLKHLLFLVAGEVFLEVTQNVHENIGVFFGCGFQTKRFHQKLLVSGAQRIRSEWFGLSHEFPHHPIVLRTMSKDHQFVSRMEIDQTPSSLGLFQTLTPPFVGKHSFNKVLPKPRIVKSPIVLDGEDGEMIHESPGKHTDAIFGGHTFLIVHLDALHAAAR